LIHFYKSTLDAGSVWFEVLLVCSQAGCFPLL
jgi:hypothetical protein